MSQTNQVDSNVSQTPNSHPGSQDEAPVVKDCYYFLTTGCTKGDKCPFRHKPEVKEVNMLCAKFLKGTCHDPNCKFIHLTSLPSASRRPHHPTERHPQTMGTPVQKECIYFKQGRCKNGDHCPYLHVTPDNAALTQQLAAIINLVQNQARGTQLTNKRSSPFNQPAKRIQVMGADGSDSLGFDAPDAKRPLQERAARVKYQVGKMMEGHAGKQARREAAPAQKTSTTDFVVRTRAQILADQKAQEEKEKAAKAAAATPATVAVTAPATASAAPAATVSAAPAATVSTTPTPITLPPIPAPITLPPILAPAETTTASSAPDAKNENSFDEDPEDEGAGDDSDFKDGSASDPISPQTSPRLTESWAQVSPNPTLFVPYTLTIMSANALFSFPILSENEIIDMMKQLGIALEIGDLNNPDPKKVVSTFVSLMSISSGTPCEEISVYNKENAKKYGLEGNQHLLSVITVFGPLNEYMNVCRVHDFSFSDLLQPTAARFREQLSAAINFIMFSDEVLNRLRVFKDKKDALTEKIQSIEDDIKVTESRRSTLEAQKQKDRAIVVAQKERNKQLEEEIEKRNIEQQRLKETANGIKVEMKEITRRINLLEQQIRDENQTTLELNNKIVASPHKLRQDVTDMKEEYARLTAECRSLSLQATDLQAQSAVVSQAANRLEEVLRRLDEAKAALENRNALSKQLEELKNHIRELRKQLEDSSIDQKKFELQKKREEEEVETLQKRVLTSSQSATEQLEGLQAEATAEETALATLTEEKSRWTTQLEEAEKEKESAVARNREEIAKRVRMMEELMQRVKKYQEAMMQSVTYWRVCWRKQGNRRKSDRRSCPLSPAAAAPP